MIIKSANGVVVRNHERAVEFKGVRLYERSVDVFRLLVAGIASFDNLERALPDANGAMARALCLELLARGFVYETESSEAKLTDLAPYRQIERYVDHTVGQGIRRMELARQGSVLVLGSGFLAAATVHALIELGTGRVDIDASQKHSERIRGYFNDAALRGKTTQCTFLNVNPSEFTKLDGYDVVVLGTEDERYDSIVAKFPWRNYVDSGVGFIAGARFEHWGIVGPLVAKRSMPCLACAYETVQSAITQVPVPLGSPSSMTNVAIAILGNEMAFEIFKALTGITESRVAPQSFLLDLGTLVGAYVRSDAGHRCHVKAHQQVPRTAHA